MAKTKENEDNVVTLPNTLGVDRKTVEDHHRRISSATQDKDDVNMELAAVWDRATKAGINKNAMKRAMRLKKQDASKTADEQRHFSFYCDVLELDAQGDLMAEAEDDAEHPDDIEDDTEDEDDDEEDFE